MLLQMVFEKLAKAAFARAGSPFPTKHEACGYLFKVLRRSPVGLKALTGMTGAEAFVVQLELAQPAVVKKSGRNSPQLEYPWEDETGTVRTPELDLSLARRGRDPKNLIGLRCLQLASALEKELWSIIP